MGAGLVNSDGVPGNMQDPQLIYRNAIEALRPRFRAAMTQHLDRLEDVLDALLEGSDPRVGLQEAKFVAHRVAGTAATFGWAALGDLARETEEALNENLALHDCGEGYLARIEVLIEALAEAIEG
jgi:HPt (histidine-containing phosphotransfer) domain-containing protein